jgi:hypothetical protein
MFRNTFGEIRCYSHRERAVTPAGHDVDARRFIHNEMGWIPAFAGMTSKALPFDR